MATPSEWWASLPPLTRLYGASCFGATLATQLGLVSPASLALFWGYTLRQLQARRACARPRCCAGGVLRASLGVALRLATRRDECGR